MDKYTDCNRVLDFNNFSKSQITRSPDFHHTNLTKKESFCYNIKSIELHPTHFNRNTKNMSKLNISSFKRSLLSNQSVNNGLIMERKMHSMKTIKLQNKFKGIEYNENNEYNKELIKNEKNEKNIKIDRIEIIDNSSNTKLDGNQTKLKQEDIEIVTENSKVKQGCCNVCEPIGIEICVIF